jgi:hypothetical protein
MLESPPKERRFRIIREKPLEPPKPGDTQCPECGMGWATPDAEENKEYLADHMRDQHGKKTSPQWEDRLGSPIAIRLPEELRANVEEIADAEGRTVSELCRELLEDALGDNPSRARRVLLRSLVISQRQVEQAARSKAIRPEDGQRILKSLNEAAKIVEAKLGEVPKKEGRRFSIFRGE